MTAPSVLIVDDEPLARRRLARLLRQHVDVGEIADATDVSVARAHLETSDVDILFLDIQMPGGSGFDLLDSLPRPPAAVIFVTAFDNQALRAFEVQAVDYLTKPIEPGRLISAFRRASEIIARRTDRDRVAELEETVAALRRPGSTSASATEFWVRTVNGRLRIPVSQVIRFDAEGDYVRIRTDKGSYLHHERLGAVEKRLERDVFIRLHRGVILRRDRIVRIRTGSHASMIAELEDGSETRVGRTHVAGVRAALLRRGDRETD